MHRVTKATFINFIDCKCLIRQSKNGKIHKTCLANHTGSMYVPSYHATGY